MAHEGLQCDVERWSREDQVRTSERGGGLRCEDASNTGKWPGRSCTVKQIMELSEEHMQARTPRCRYLLEWQHGAMTCIGTSWKVPRIHGQAWCIIPYTMWCFRARWTVKEIEGNTPLTTCRRFPEKGSFSHCLYQGYFASWSWHSYTSRNSCGKVGLRSGRRRPILKWVSVSQLSVLTLSLTPHKRSAQKTGVIVSILICFYEALLCDIWINVSLMGTTTHCQSLKWTDLAVAFK